MPPLSVAEWIARLRTVEPNDAATKAAEDAEFERLRDDAMKTAAGASTAARLPRFYRPSKAEDLVFGSDDVSALYQPASLTCTQLRALLRSAGRHVEVERYMELIETWDNLPPSRFWDALRDVKRVEYEAAVAAPGNAAGRAGASSDTFISYPTFLDAVERLRANIMEAYPETGVRICELVTGVATSPEGAVATAPTTHGGIPIEGWFGPKVDATLFLACPRQPDGTVEFTQLYSQLMVQLSVLKTTAELVMRDGDNDGRLSEAELEEYAALLCHQVQSTSSIPENLVPFFACAVTRRLIWALETPNSAAGRGFISIDRLLATEELRAWIECQLALDGNAATEGWYSAAYFEALYGKFSQLNSRGGNLLVRADFTHYKKGVPPVENDGLPSGMCPISELFIDRYFEVADTFSGEMDFKQFVDFVLNVEYLPGKCQRPWLFFDIFDLNGDGFITPTELQAFFAETRAKLVCAGLQDTVSVELFVRELFDALNPKESLRCSRAEFIASPQAAVVCGTLIDPLAFFSYDTRDNNVAPRQQQLYRYEQPIRR